MLDKDDKRKKNPYLFKKGQSGNPKGRPKKGQSFSEILERELLRQTKEMNLNGEQRVVNGKELLALSLISIAFGKNTKNHEKMVAIERIMDRIDGKAAQGIGFSGVVETAAKVMFVDDLSEDKE